MIRNEVRDDVIVVPLYGYAGHVEVQFILPVTNVVGERLYSVSEHMRSLTALAIARLLFLDR